MADWMYFVLDVLLCDLCHDFYKLEISRRHVDFSSLSQERSDLESQLESQIQSKHIKMLFKVNKLYEIT